MVISSSFSRYVGRRFLLWFAGSLLVLAAVVALFDTLELARRTASKPEATGAIVAAMALSRLPHLVEKTIPFAVLFAAILAFWRMNRGRELVIARAAGLSAWQFLAPVLASAVLIGALEAAALDPLASTLFLNWKKLEAKYIKRKTDLVDLTDEGLWLRQSIPGGHYILHADSIAPTDMTLRGVVVFMMEGEDRFRRRIDAGSARLEKGGWMLARARVVAPGKRPAVYPALRLDTSLTRKNLQDSFAPPDTISFWELPRFIRVLESAGFSALRHRLHLHQELAQPLLLCALVLIAAAISMRPQRQKGVGALIVVGVGVAFMLYVATDVVSALGASGRLPIALAAWAPSAVATLLGTAVLFHLEDG